MTSDPKPTASVRVEAYLDQVLAPLSRRLSAFHQQELRRELRTHLWERVDAYRELGQSEDAAVTEALRQFGGAEDFLRQWRREWTKNPVVSAPTLRLWEAGKAALKPALTGIAAAFVPFVALEQIPYSKHTALAEIITGPFGMAFFWSLTTFTFLLLPALVGARQGRRQPNAGAGMAAVLTAGIATVSLLYAAVDEVASDNLRVEGLFSILLSLLVIWLPISSGSAAVSGWWTRRLAARRLV